MTPTVVLLSFTDVKTTAILALLLALASQEILGAAPDGFVFTPGEEYSYKVEIKRQWRTITNLPNWVGELKVWPIEQHPNGQIVVRARIAMNPDWPGDTFTRHDTIAWAEFEVDSRGKISAPYQFVPSSSEAPRISLTFPLPDAGAENWREQRENGTEADYNFSQGSSVGTKFWEIDADFRNPRYEVEQYRLHEHFTYDRTAGRVQKWTSRGDYQKGAYVWNTTTVSFVGERTVPTAEFAGIKHDSKLLLGTMTEFNALFDEAEDPVDDLDTFRNRVDALTARMPGLLAQIQDPAFHEDYSVFHSLSPEPLVDTAKAALQKRDALLNKPSPDWTAQDLSGTTYALKDYRGKIVLLDFWAHACGPCLISTPALSRIAHDYAAQPFVLIGMNVADSPDDMRHAMTKMQMTNTQLVGLHVVNTYGFSGLPMYLLIDQDGIVRARHLGWDDSMEPQLRTEIEGLLQKMAPGSSIAPSH